MINRNIWFIVCIQLPLLLLNIALFHSLRLKMSRNTPKSIKITIYLYFISLFIYATNGIIYDTDSLWENEIPPETYSKKVFIQVHIITIFVSDLLNLISVPYFLRIKVEDTFKNTQFSINQCIINTCFIIYLISLFAKQFTGIMKHALVDHYLHSIANKEYRKMSIQFYIIQVLYLLLILILFRIKFSRYKTQYSINGGRAAMLMTRETIPIKHNISKQTRLISIITITSLIESIYIDIYQNEEWIAKDAYLSISYDIFPLFYYGIIGICIYLSFKFNDPIYDKICQYFRKKETNNIDDHDYFNFHIQSDNTAPVNMEIIYNSDRTCKPYMYNQCEIVANICKFLTDDFVLSDDTCTSPINQHNFSIFDESEDLGTMSTENDCTISDINNYYALDVLDNFDHLLQYHDDNKAFKFIYTQLTQSFECVSSTECDRFIRNSRRRLIRDDNEEKQYDKEDNIFDKHIRAKIDIRDRIHSYYYHSYDIGSRLRTIEKITDNQKLNMIEEQKLNIDVNIDRFNSDAGLFKFGQRFEYDDNNHIWYVGPRYQDIKDEVLNNKIETITNVIFDEEYSKSKTFMATTRVKTIKARNDDELLIDHILSLLIYCNCDKYQSKWSSTFWQKSGNDSDDANTVTRDQVIQMHSNFYFVSKYLIQLVENFGNELVHKKKFYHGVNQPLTFDRTMAEFNCPLSTSTEIIIAYNFSGGIGLVMELEYAFSMFPSSAKYFNCAFFSDYPNEKECLFIGGVPLLQISNIINIGAKNADYRIYINALNKINAIFNGTYQPTNDFNNDQLCCELLSHSSMKCKKKKKKNHGIKKKK
eukprot:120332_1